MVHKMIQVATLWCHS